VGIAAAVLAAAGLAATQLLFPLPEDRRDGLRNSFNEKRGARSHEAVDIMAPRGTPVYAVQDGRVAKLFNSVPGGKAIYQFDPTERFAYYYAHLDRYAAGLADGKRVRRGEIIGYVGSTGNAAPDAPHLHFAIFRLGPKREWWKGEAIDPYPYLAPAIPPG
jgi:peptidoglycan LD-endopeptidase LytH